MAIPDTVIDTRQVEHNGKAFFPVTSQTPADQQASILDRNWTKQAFLISDVNLGSAIDVFNRYWSSASAKFTDTRIGGNIGINARPQFTRYSDIRDMGRMGDRNQVELTDTTGNYGMGRYYSEAIDDPAQTVYLRFGVPQFNALTSFLSRAYDAEMMSIAKTGNGLSIFYRAGQAAGTLFALTAFPAIALTIIGGEIINSFFTRPTSKFYTLKPTMEVYWSTVNLLVNTLTINRGIIPKILADDKTQRLGKPFTLDQEYLNQISELLPDIFKNGYVDTFAIANKAQKIANRVYRKEYDDLNRGSATNFFGFLRKRNDKVNTYMVSNDANSALDFSTLGSFINRFCMFSSEKGAGAKPPTTQMNPKVNTADTVGGTYKEPQGFWKQYAEYFDAEARAGSQYAVFKVDFTGSVGDSFGNSTVESEMSQKLNGAVSQVRDMRFSMADGNVVGGVAGEVAGAAVGAVKDVALGAIAGLTMGASNVVLGLAGAGFIDIPKHWQSSNASIGRSSYSMQLISPYGNAFSQLQNIYIPLCMLMAGALPLSVGKQAYASPFLCQLFDRGRQQIRLGMIESLTITRGTSNLAFNLNGNALAIDVTFTVADLSSIMHMPVSSGALGGFDVSVDEDNILADYLAVLAGQDIYSQIYTFPKLRLNAAKKTIGYNSLVNSPAHWAMITESLPLVNCIEGLVAGSSSIAGATAP